MCMTGRRSSVSLAKEHSPFSPDVPTSSFLEPGHVPGAEAIAVLRLCGGISCVLHSLHGRPARPQGHFPTFVVF